MLALQYFSIFVPQLTENCYIQYFSPGKEDYTKERYQWLHDKSLDDVYKEMQQFKGNDTNQYEEIIE